MSIDWISVKDRLPENKTDVLTYSGNHKRPYVMFYWQDDFLLNGARYTLEVTHWAEINLPDGGKEKEE